MQCAMRVVIVFASQNYLLRSPWADLANNFEAENARLRARNGGLPSELKYGEWNFDAPFNGDVTCALFLVLILQELQKKALVTMTHALPHALCLVHANCVQRARFEVQRARPLAIRSKSI